MAGVCMMDLKVLIGDKEYRVALEHPHSIAIPVHFDSEQLSAFGAPPAQKQVYKADGFTGSVAQGGSCNCETYTITPHCNGTHTESVGHITENNVYIHDALQDALVPALVVTVMPETAAACGESYNESLQPDDLVITQKSLEANPLTRHIGALVVRTLPNDDEKMAKDYGEAMPPYFTTEALDYIATSKVKHLLVDVPSVDRMDDGGALINHRAFWGMGAGETRAAVSPKTITELIYVPDAVKDGLYLLNLQVAPLLADAAPSRPVLYEVTPL